MGGSFLDPNTCGFARVAAFEASKAVRTTLQRKKDEGKYHFTSRRLQEQYKHFKACFHNTGERFEIDYRQYIKKLPSLRDVINRWDHAKENLDRTMYLNTFSQASWDRLSESRKKEHTFLNCRACCVRYAGVQALFPIHSPRFKSNALRNPVSAAINEANQLKHNHVLTPSNADIRKTAQVLHEKVSPTFEKVYKVSLTEALSTLPDDKKATKNKKRQERRHHYRQTKINIENQMSETACLRYVTRLMCII